MEPSRLRDLPSIGQLAERDDVRALAGTYPRSRVLRTLREALDMIRNRLLQAGDGEDLPLPTAEEIVERAARDLGRSAGPGVRKAINATGVILHTGLGRAVLSRAARKALFEMDGYSLVQMDPVTGERCLREAHIQKILTELTGAEAVTVVNNNAGATLLVLNTVAKGKDVIVSRGQLVEIGGSFRIPDVMAQSGARLVEVGTTNRTHLRDYERAITEETAALLHVHTSNYRVKGFTKTVSIAELATLGRKYNLPVIDDLGSGALVDLARFGFGTEPLARDSVRDGADLVTFSADKLVGGPQGGIILGSEKQIDKIRKNSLGRALRVDKLTLAALEMTLREFLDEESLMRNHPVMRLFSIPAATLKRRAGRLARKIESAVAGVEATFEQGAGRIGSGSLPLEDVPTWVVAVRAPSWEVGKLGLAMRMGDPPVFARVSDDRLLFDVRTILDAKEEKAIVNSLAEIITKGP
jgi:L-seryl-tRNA(Ser) seleniumtransferase